MRYVPSLPPITGIVESRQVQQTSRVRRVQPAAAQGTAELPQQEEFARLIEMLADEVRHRDAQRRAGPAVTPRPELAIFSGQRATQAEERRKYCRRILHLPVLEELRSGLDRRHHHIRTSDFAEHIDEEV
ncbi:MAG: hypothetical protein HY849_02705 [Nitrosomonadales bacterium]|nr:hypothetical protein [Nitrosomonadales bacterium]